MLPINVLWVIDHVCYDGNLHGGGRLYWNVVPKFDRRRVRIVPCFLRSSEVLRRVFAQAPAPVRILNKGKFDLTTVWTLLQLIRREHIDVMHLHCYGSSSFGRVAGWMAGVPAMVHDYDTEVYFPYPWYLWITDRLLAGRTAGAVAASPMVRDYAIKKRHIDPKIIRVMFHAVPEEKFRPLPAGTVAAVRDKLGAGPGDRIVGTVTKLGPQRGNADLLKAAAEVLKQVPQALFLLVYKETIYHRAPQKKYVADPHLSDSQEGRSALQQLAAQLGIEDRVRWVDSWDRSDELIAAMDLMVAPFLSQRFSSVKLLEAMAMGKPVIATDLGEQRKIIRSGVDGHLVPPGDTSALADRIVQVLSRPDRLQALGHGARETARKYSVNSYVHDLEDCYLELAAKRRSRWKGSAP